MANLSIRNLPDEVHRALRVRAARKGTSTEAEVRAILEDSVKPETRLKLGSLLVEIGREAGLTEEDLAIMEQARDTTSARSASFE